MQNKEILRRFKILQEKASYLRSELKKIDQEKKHLERLILHNILKDMENIEIPPFLIMKKYKENYEPDPELTWLAVKDKEVPYRFFKPKVTELKRVYTRAELEDIGEFVKKYYVDVKLLEG